MVTFGCISLGGSAIALPLADAKRLNHDELVSLIAGGARLRPLPIGAGIGASRREYFRSTGEYEGCGDRFEVFGTFAVRRDALCVTTKKGTGCRQILRSPTGDYFEQFEPASTSRRVEISKSTEESCRTVGVVP
jgi:hypothetical protein